MGRKEIIRTIYLYLFSLVGLVLVVMGSVKAVDLGLKTYVFKNAERIIVYPEGPRPAVPEKSLVSEKEKISEEEQESFKKEQEEFQKKELESRRDREAANAAAMIIVGAPLFWYHWKLVQKGREEK